MNEPARRTSERVAQELRAGTLAALSGRLEAPPGHARLHRFVHGFALPFSVFRTVMRDPKTRSAYVTVLGVELAIVVPIAFACVWFSEHFRNLFAGHGWKATLEETLALLGVLYTALSVLEWIVIAFAREHHDALSCASAIVTRAPTEAPPPNPRVRLDLGWLWTKAKRKVRAVVLVVVGVPAIALTLALPLAGEPLYATLMAAWAFYWLAVFALANTFLAWELRDPREPWFLRAGAAFARIPVLGWIAIPYVAIVRRVTRNVRPACLAFEEAPYEAAGLALARAILGIPIVWLAARPIFNVAATHALAGARAAQVAGTSIDPSR